MKNKFDNYVALISALAGVVTLVLAIFVETLNSNFNILMSIVFIALCFVPYLLHFIFKWNAPPYMLTIYYVFILLSTLGGTIYGLYDAISFYDIILHTLSGVLLGAFGYYLYNAINKNESQKLIIVVLFIIGFALIGGVLWEIWEFLTDEILGYNSQKFILPNGEVLTGHDALVDTMVDLICDLVGSLIFAIIFIVVRIKKKRKSN